MSASKRLFMEQREREEMQSEMIAPPPGSKHMIRIPNVEITKTLIKAEAARIIEAIKDGEADPLKMIGYLNALDRVIKDVRSAIMNEAVDEFAKYGEREVSVLGAVKLSQAEAGVRLNFSNTDAWNEIKAEENAVAARRKELEATLKTIKRPGAITIDDELVEVNPPIRTSSTVIKVEIGD